MNKKPPTSSPASPTAAQKARAEALRSLSIAHEPSGSDNPALSVAAVEAFNSQADQARSPAGAGEEEDLKSPMQELTPVAAPRLNDAQLNQGAELDLLLQKSEAISIAEATRELDDRQKEMERLRQIEAELEPIDLTSLLYDGTCSQTVPVCPQYSLTFDLPPSELDLFIADVAQIYVERFQKAGKQPLSLNWVTRVTTLACSLTRVGETPMPAVKILNRIRAGKSKDEQISEEVLEVLRQTISKPTPLLQLWVKHHTLFILRVRNALNHAGYVEYIAEKS